MDRLLEFLEKILEQDKDLFISLIILIFPFGLVWGGLINIQQLTFLESPLALLIFFLLVIVCLFLTLTRLNKLYKILKDGSQTNLLNENYQSIISLMREVTNYLKEGKEEKVSLITQMIEVQQALKKMPNKKQIIQSMEYGLLTLTSKLIDVVITFSRESSTANNISSQQTIIKKAELDIHESKEEVIKILDIYLYKLISDVIYKSIENELNKYMEEIMQIILHDNNSLDDKILNINLLTRTLSNKILSLVSNNLKWPDEN